MQGDGHHFWATVTAFVVEGVEGRFNVVVEIGWGAEAGWDVEFVVVAIYHPHISPCPQLD